MDKGFYSSSQNEGGYEGGYGYNYRNYRLPANEQVGLKGKIEQKYWKTKQKAIEKLGKDQDEFVISGDAEVDARLEAFQHIKMTCMQLMYAIEIYQTKIFALSQDENEMGRFLREQGALDKTKAGKMMISVGKAQSFAAQQRLGLRASLARLFSELETFRFRAIQDTQITVTKMEQARTDYRSRLLWMADISKELDPEQMKRLDKYRDVQQQVKAGKQLFDKLKADVIQKIDLLSASRCNLLSATLEPYQSAMITFLSSTSKSYNAVYKQFQGYPSFQFQVLKNIIPNNGIVDGSDEEEEEDPTQSSSKGEESKDVSKKETKLIEAAKEASEKPSASNEISNEDSDDDKLISFDAQDESIPDEAPAPPKEQTADLLGSLEGDLSPGFGEYTSANENTPAVAKPQESVSSIDDLLFGLPSDQASQEGNGAPKSDMDLLSDVLGDNSLGINDREMNNSFASQWQSMFGTTSDISELDNNTNSLSNFPLESGGETDSNNQFMPSFLLDQIGQSAMNEPSGKNVPTNNADLSKSKPLNLSKGMQRTEQQGKDMSTWLSLFADLDPLSNPDAVGPGDGAKEGKQAC